MTNNTEAVEKIHNMLRPKHDDLSKAKAILAAIQADPLAYVRPKPLEWVRDGNRWFTDVLDLDYYHIVYDDRSTVGDYSLFIRGEWSPFPTLEAAQAAAYDDLCNRMKELF